MKFLLLLICLFTATTYGHESSVNVDRINHLKKYYYLHAFEDFDKVASKIIKEPFFSLYWDENSREKDYQHGIEALNLIKNLENSSPNYTYSGIDFLDRKKWIGFYLPKSTSYEEHDIIRTYQYTYGNNSSKFNSKMSLDEIEEIIISSVKSQGYGQFLSELKDELDLILEKTDALIDNAKKANTHYIVQFNPTKSIVCENFQGKTFYINMLWLSTNTNGYFESLKMHITYKKPKQIFKAKKALHQFYNGPFAVKVNKGYLTNSNFGSISGGTRVQDSLFYNTGEIGLKIQEQMKTSRTIIDLSDEEILELFNKKFYQLRNQFVIETLYKNKVPSIRPLNTCELYEEL